MNIFRVREIFKICIIAILVFTLLSIPSFGDVQNVTVSVTPEPKIDIILTQKNNKTDMTNLKDDLNNKLSLDGFDTKNINYQTVQTETTKTSAEALDFKSAVVNWETIGSPIWTASDTEIYCSVKGQPVPTTGAGSVNRQYSDPNLNFKDISTGYTADWTSALIDPNNYKGTKYNTTFSVEKNGNLYEGYCFFVNKGTANDRLSGYFFNVVSHAYYFQTNDPNSAIYITNTNGYQCNLWRFDNWDADSPWATSINCGPLHCMGGHSGVSIGGTYSYQGATIKLLSSWSYNRAIGQYANYTVDASGGNIKIKVDDNVVADVFDDTYTMGTQGFWGDNCERQASMRVNTFVSTVTKEYIKSFKEVLLEPTWRDNAYHIILNANDGIDETLTGSDVAGENATRLLNDKIHLLQWGTDNNKDDISNFINQMNDGNGMFTYNNNYTQAIADTANYIENLVKQGTSSQYVIVRRRY